MSKIGDLAIELMELGALVPDRYEPDMASYKGDNELSNTNPKGKAKKRFYGRCSFYDDSHGSYPDDTPSEMNEWLKRGGW